MIIDTSVNMSALAGLNAARRSFTQRDTVTQEVEEDVFQEDFALPVGLDHTKFATSIGIPKYMLIIVVTGYLLLLSRTAKESPISSSYTAQRHLASFFRVVSSLQSTVAQAWVAMWRLRQCKNAFLLLRQCLCAPRTHIFPSHINS
jgi:hypothetical protein